MEPPDEKKFRLWSQSSWREIDNCFKMRVRDVTFKRAMQVVEAGTTSGRCKWTQGDASGHREMHASGHQRHRPSLAYLCTHHNTATMPCHCTHDNTTTRPAAAVDNAAMFFSRHLCAPCLFLHLPLRASQPSQRARAPQPS